MQPVEEWHPNGFAPRLSLASPTQRVHGRFNLLWVNLWHRAFCQIFYAGFFYKTFYQTFYREKKRMSELTEKDDYVVEERGHSGLLLGLLAVTLLLAIASLVWTYTLQGRLVTAENKVTTAAQENTRLGDELAATNARLKATSETLGQSVGMTQKQLEARAMDILRSQKVETARLEKEQQATKAQLGVVSSDVSSVKTDVGGVKTDVGGVKSDLADTKSQLQRVMGDAGVMSGEIATNKSELEILKHKGDRNYYEFTLNKGSKPTLVSTVTLQLKKADVKHSRYTMEVSSDDRKIEKKDKGLNEPVQFYSGKTPQLYELVVNNINKNQVTGYLSTPKTPAQTSTAQ